MNCWVFEGLSFGPDGLLYGLGYDSNFDINSIYQIDINGTACSLIFDGPPGLPPNMRGLVAMGNGIFYSMAWMSDTLYKWDVNAGSVSVVGTTGYQAYGEMCLSNGIIYYTSRETTGPFYSSIIQLDYINPSNSFRKVSLEPQFGFFGITATGDPGYLFGQEIWKGPGECELYRISLVDGSLESVCDITPFSWGGAFSQITSPLEHNQSPPTPPFIDLDCDDSSGAIESDYNGIPYNCLVEGGVAISDDDPRIRTDAPIAQMTCKITPYIPDAPDEILGLSGTLTGINVTGLGTSMLTLTNGGGATIQNFLDALQLVVYEDLSFSITPGIRTIEVKFTNTAGAQSNIGKAFIEVIALPYLDLDLGPDLEPCIGETVVLSANYPGGTYQWSTGEQSESITVDQSGLYSVTVSDDTHCPNRDTVEVEYVPIVQVWLTGDTSICQGETAELILTNNAGFTITVLITHDPGPPILLEDIPGEFHFTDIPFSNTEYVIDEVTLSQPACIEIPDPEQIIEVWPVYSGINDSIAFCQGDSVLLGNLYYDTAGTFEVKLNSFHGCDSLVNYTISLLPAEHLFYSSTTCDPSLAGVIYSFLTNAVGCDTVVQTTVSLLPTDTTLLTDFTCRISESGLVIDSLTNQFGCDSLIATTVAYLSPADTTEVIQFTCDSAQISTFFTLATSSIGCDSLIHTQVVIPAPDSTMIFNSTCDTSAVGIIEIWYNGFDGCDSLVIQTTQLVTNDTSLVLTTSCDSADLGTFITTYALANSCDSVVITTINFSLADSTYLTSATCDPANTGMFTMSYVNQFGCDSFVIETVSLLPSDQVTLSGTSCNPADTGTFIVHLFNQFGCDSMITQIISLLPSNLILIQSTTCDQALAGQDTTIFQNQFGCDSLIVETTVFLEPDTTYQNGFSCNPLDTGTISLHFQNSYGCDSVVIQGTQQFPLPSLLVISVHDYNGYHISCYGGYDGMVSAEVNGVTPFQYTWSQGSNQSTVSAIPAGLYSITVSDANGCSASGAINLLEPPPLSLQLLVSEPDCFEEGFGVVLVNASGGAPPYQYSMDHVLYSLDNTFESLTDGIYTFYTLDANDCESSEIIAINIPVPVNVDLGDNQVLDIGDTTIISAMVNVPSSTLDSIAWYGIDSIACPTCLQQAVIPFITTAYSIEVINDDGCRDQDEVIVTVIRNGEIFVPNIFSPNGDGINDVLQIYAGAFVESIERFNIFDRWGNLVFTASHFDPRQEQFSWDGTFKSKMLNPAVYAFQLVARLKDGSQIIRHGDISLIR